MLEKRTRQQAREWLREQNLTISEWARQNGYTTLEVSRVLSGESKCLYGRGREVAIKLNIEVPK